MRTLETDKGPFSMVQLRRVPSAYRDLLLGLSVVAIVSEFMLRDGIGAILHAQNGSSNLTATAVLPRLDCVLPDPDNPGFYIAAFGYERLGGNVSPATISITYGTAQNALTSNAPPLNFVGTY